MSNFKKLALIAGALFLNFVIACGGTPKDQVTTNSPGLKVPMLGRSFQLVEVNYTATHTVYTAKPNDYVFTITSDKTIAGTIFGCNTFSSGAIWAADTHLYISNYSPTTNVCSPTQTAPPIVLTQVMNFSFVSDTQLVISDSANTFTASFARR